MVDLINFQEDWLHNIVSDKLKVDLVKEVHYVFLAASEEVVKADHLDKPGEVPTAVSTSST
jgi:hypothetical protein